MYNVNDLLAKIQAGADPEALANDFAAALNSALELDKKQKEADLAAKAAAQKEADLNKYAADMATAMLNYIKAADPEAAAMLEDDDLADITEIRKMLDASIKSVRLALDLANKFSSSLSTPDPKESKNSDDVISDFLRSIGL